ncbi:MAG: 3-methyl-2-oxobutanoate hydroxymethyltransferase [Planctomycetota bacterium]|jgi:3-methyl-2-oxobutanoate hydroxymethyltransferase
MNKRFTIADLVEARRNGQKIAAVSCYDYTTAKLAADAGVEMILVGDSAAQIMLGYDSTLPATMDFMVTITAAVHRAAANLCLIADMPFLSYHTGVPEAVSNAGRFVKEAGANMIKIEATTAHLDVIKAVSDAEMAVMAHIGIKPQSISKVGKLKAEGTTAELACDLIVLAESMVKAGASALLLEGTAKEVAKIITRRVSVPVIGCGSGPDCDGQILIISDILGLSPGPAPKFSKNYADLKSLTIKSVSSYVKEVHQAAFPDDPHCYHMKSGQLEKLQKMLETLGS